jgi:glycolate oxidase FAD binding subunit
VPTSTTSPIAAVRSVLGDEGTREATAADAVLGVQPAAVGEPASVEEASALLAMCSARGFAVVPRGGGTKLAWGAPPERVDIVLSTRRMDSVVDHPAGDLVVVVRAGCPLDRLQERLAEGGQMLALDPSARAGATVGGVTAAAASGPRRLRYGTPRDLLIGITVVLSDGTVARAGGRVVKNVAGYDLGKLFAGSFGTLGLIAELTFRLHPLPEASRTVEVDVATAEAASAAVGLAVSRPMDPVAVELTWPPASPHGGTVRTIFEGSEPGVRAQTDRIMSLLGHPTGKGIGHPVLRAEPDDEGEPAAPARAVTIKVTHPPSVLASALRAAWDATGPDVPPALQGHAATGVTFVSMASSSTEQVADTLGSLRAFAAGVGGSAVVLDAPVEVKVAVDSWGPAGDALGLMRRVKERFDPTRTMSPGRFVGGI